MLIDRTGASLARSTAARSAVAIVSPLVSALLVVLIAHAAPASAPTPAARHIAAVAPGVLLRVIAPDHPDITNTYRVNPDGTLQLPRLGSISVNGLSLPEVSSLLTGRVATLGGKAAKIRVEFDHSLQSVLVAGQVRVPGLISMKGPLSLIKVLGHAGSPTAAAGDVVVIIHDEFPHDASSQTQSNEVRTRVRLKDLQAGRDVALHDGDTVFVPKAQTFYILGDVARPGLYVLTSGLTVTQAIALAGGLTPRGSDRGIRVMRSVDGEAVEVDAGPGRVVQADDTIKVRGRRF